MSIDHLFAVADLDRDGVLTGGEAVSFFMKSGLQKAVLRQVWELSTSGKPSMDKVSFGVALKLIALAQARPTQDLEPNTAMALVRGVYVGAPIPMPTLQGVSMNPLPPPVQQAAPPAAPMPAPSPIGPGGFGAPQAVPQAPPGALTVEDENRYKAMFQQADADRDGLLQGGECAPLMASTGLPRDQLGRVWGLVAGTRGHLTVNEFVSAMHLIAEARKGTPFPAALPPGYPPRAPAPAAAPPPQMAPAPVPAAPVAPPPQPAPAPLPMQPAAPPPPSAVSRGPIDLGSLVGGAPPPSAAALSAQFMGGGAAPGGAPPQMGGFMQPQQQQGQPQPGYGGFGAPQQQMQQGGFGQAPQQGAFGQAQPQPGGFGQAPGAGLGLGQGYGASGLTPALGGGYGGAPGMGMQPPAQIQTDPTQHAVYPDGTAFAYQARVQAPPPGLLANIQADERHRIEGAYREAQTLDQGIQKADFDFTNAKRRQEFYNAALRDLLMYKSRATGQLLEAQERAARAMGEAAQAEKGYEDGWKQQEMVRAQMGKALEVIEASHARREAALAKLREAQAESHRIASLDPQEEARRAEAEVQQIQMQIQAEVAKGDDMRRIMEAKHRAESQLKSRLEEARLSIVAAEAELPRLTESVKKLEGDVKQLEEKPALRDLLAVARAAQGTLLDAARYALKLGVVLPEELRRTPLVFDSRAEGPQRAIVSDWDDFRDDGFTPMHASVVLPSLPQQTQQQQALPMPAPQQQPTSASAGLFGAMPQPGVGLGGLGGFSAAGPPSNSNTNSLFGGGLGAAAAAPRPGGGFGAQPVPIASKAPPAAAPRAAAPGGIAASPPDDGFDFLDGPPQAARTPSPAPPALQQNRAPAAAPAPPPAAPPADLFSWE